MARETTAEMLGEAFREFGVLLLLFAPLERIVVRAEPLTLKFAATVITLVVLFIGGGIGIERQRKLEQ